MVFIQGGLWKEEGEVKEEQEGAGEVETSVEANPWQEEMPG